MVRYRPYPLRSSGFTLVEILIALVFVSVLVPIAVQAIANSSRAGVMAERRRMAAMLAEKILNEAILTEDWRTGSMRGDFGEDFPEYTYEISRENWIEETMSEVVAEVFFKVQGIEYSTQFRTLADAEELEPEEEEETEEADTGSGA